MEVILEDNCRKGGTLRWEEFMWRAGDISVVKASYLFSDLQPIFFNIFPVFEFFFMFWKIKQPWDVHSNKEQLAFLGCTWYLPNCNSNFFPLFSSFVFLRVLWWASQFQLGLIRGSSCWISGLFTFFNQPLLFRGIMAENGQLLSPSSGVVSNPLTLSKKATKPLWLSQQSGQLT